MEEQLTLHEGREVYPYIDTVGKVTIGVGWNLTDNGLPEEVIDLLLDMALDNHWKELTAQLPWVSTLDEVRQRVLLDMAFNLGVPKLLKFKNTLAMVKKGDYAAASKGMLQSKWATQVGKRARRLATMMKTGKLPPELGV
jgi:lysozyme